MEIKELLIKQLKENFKNIKVYDEPIQQGLSTPCFILETNKATHTRELGDITNTHVFILLSYYPSDTDNLWSEFDRIINTFTSGAFKYLANQYHINALDFETNLEDRVMVVSFTLDIKRIKRREGQPMQQIERSVEIVKEEATTNVLQRSVTSSFRR
ncbi:hypothetical protein NHG32_06905 [Aerococcaceae bacterium NML191219]|nr:hypothetical protein [Aerococcaceae bacterium NML191219]